MCTVVVTCIQEQVRDLRSQLRDGNLDALEVGDLLNLLGDRHEMTVQLRLGRTSTELVCFVLNVVVVVAIPFDGTFV